jgi:hypothetical protein
LKRRWKTRNLITDYTVSHPTYGTVCSHGHENLKSKMFVDFLFICVRLHPAPKLRLSGALLPLPLGDSMVCYLWFICEIWVFISSCVAEVSRVLVCYDASLVNSCRKFRNKYKNCWTYWPRKWTHFSSPETWEIHQTKEVNIPADSSL